MDLLRLLTWEISIITGALDKEDRLLYNATYLFQKGNIQIAHKVVLVPFGEAVPLPQKIRDFINDKFYNKSVNRSILISCLSSYTLTKSHNIEIPFGYLGENILLDYNPYKLKIGTHLKIGNVILEITQNCTICNHLAIIDKSIPELLKNDRGIFAKVIKSGEIKQEDEVCLEF